MAAGAARAQYYTNYYHTCYEPQTVYYEPRQLRHVIRDDCLLCTDDILLCGPDILDVVLSGDVHLRLSGVPGLLSAPLGAVVVVRRYDEV